MNGPDKRAHPLRGAARRHPVTATYAAVVLAVLAAAATVDMTAPMP